MILCDIILLGQTCNAKQLFSFLKHLENIRGSDRPYIHALKNHFGSLTEDIIELRQANKK